MGNFLSASSKSITKQELGKPLLSFGVLADIQYADCDDLIEFRKKRYYRNSLVQIRQFVADMNEVERKQNVEFKFVLQLGDLLDGITSRIENPQAAMNRVLKELYAKNFRADNGFPPLLHIWGNHEFYNFNRYKLAKTPMNSARNFPDCAGHADHANYYSLNLTDNLCLICLDMYERSVIGYKHDDPAYIDSERYLLAHREESPKSPFSRLAPDKYRRYNGAMSDLQMAWLSARLEACRQSRRKAIVCGHIPLHPKSVPSDAVAWNNDEVVGLFNAYSDVVVAYMAGHYHPGGYYLDKHIHYIILSAVLECHPTSQTYSMVHVYSDRVSIISTGTNPSLTIPLQFSDA